MYTEEQNKESRIDNAEEKYGQYEQVLDKYRDQDGSLIKILHQGQQIFGYLPREVLIYTAHKLKIPFPEIYGIVSFYSHFTMKKRGEKTIEVCLGTACYVKGAEEILNKFKQELDIEPGEISDDGKFSLETTHCVGACSLAPVVSVDEKVYSKVTPDMVEAILRGDEEIAEEDVELDKNKTAKEKVEGKAGKEVKQ
ncbi:MAG: NAD(P)H-dependent oxidoreductase subunit E [Halanaerobiaceae bacterium]